MLFMVTMTHTAESCPANNPEKMPEAMESVDAMGSLARSCLEPYPGAAQGTW